MSDRALELLEFLLQQKGWLTSKKLTIHFCISTRTLRTIVSECNHNKNLVLSSNNGYKLNEEYIDDVRSLLENKSKQDQQPKDRYNLIIQRLIMSPKPLDLFDLSEELHISVEQVSKDLTKVKKYLNDNNLSLDKENDGYVVNGQEYSKRHAMTKLFIKEINQGELASNVMKNITSAEQIHTLSDILKQNLREAELYVNDYAFMSLIVHLVITVNRGSSHKLDEVLDDTSLSIDSEEYKVAKNVFEDIEKQYNITFSKSDIDELAILLTTQIQPIIPSSISNVKDYIGDRVYKLVNKIVNNVLLQYHLDLNSNTFFTKFAIHIKNLLYRAQVNRKTDNPYIETVKQSAPLVFEISVYIANIIAEETNIQISDDEIAYIALHISNVINDKKEDDKIKAVLVCPSYYDLGTNIMMRISTYFDNTLEITSIVHFEDELNPVETYDIILSMLPLNKTSEYTKISPVLGEIDFKNIEKALEKKKAENSRKQLKEMLKILISEDRFIILNKESSKEEVLNELVGYLIKDKIVGNDYLAKVYDREKMSSTCYGKIAIPHSLKPSAFRNGISVAISKNPIKWDDKKVNMVFLLAISEGESIAFGDIYNKLVTALYDDEIVDKLIECNNFNDFLKILIYGAHE